MRQEHLTSRELLMKLGRLSRPEQSHVLIVLAVGAAILGGTVVPIYAAFVDNSPLRLAAIPALLALTFLLILNPRVLLCFILVLRAGMDNLFDESKISVLGYAIGLGGLLNAFIILTVLVLIAQRPMLLPGKLGHAWAGFFLTVTLGVIISPFKVDAVRYFLTTTTYFAVFTAAFYVVRSEADWRSAVRLILWSSVIPVVYAFFDLAVNARTGMLSSFRLESTFTHANIFAFYLLLTLTLILYVRNSRTFNVSSGTKIGLTAYACYVLILLVLTQTRSAWLACVALFAAYGFFFERRYLVYLAVGCGLLLLVPTVHERLIDVLSGSERGFTQYVQLDSFAWRRKLWESGLQWMEPAHYAFGYGAQSFPNYSHLFFPELGTPPRSEAHNVYIQWFFDYGVVGLAALLWLFYTILEHANKLRRIERLAAFVVTITVVTYAICALSDNMMGYLAFNWYVWFLIGAGFAWARVSAADTIGDKPVRRHPRPQTCTSST